MGNKQKKKEEWVLWQCNTCEGYPQFEQAEFLEHIKNTHNIIDTKGKREMRSHLDAADWYEWNYEWTIGELTFMQQVHLKRKGLDKALWKDG